MRARSSIRTSSASAIAIRPTILLARAAISSAACWRARYATTWRIALSSTAARRWCSWTEGFRASSVRSVNGVQSRRWRLRGLLPRRCGLKALPLPLPHELIIFGGAGSGRRVGRKAPGPLRQSIGDSGRELLVDAAAAAQHACGERNGNDDSKMTDTDWHLRGVAFR